MVSRFGTDTSPSSGLSSPVIIRNKVVFPAPLGPTSPIFSPGLSWKDASTKSTWRPYCLLIRENAIIPFHGTRVAVLAAWRAPKLWPWLPSSAVGCHGSSHGSAGFALLARHFGLFDTTISYLARCGGALRRRR